MKVEIIPIISVAKNFEALEKTATEVMLEEATERTEQRYIAEIKKPLIDWFKRYLALDEWWNYHYGHLRQWGFDSEVYGMLRFVMILKEGTKQVILQEGR